MRAAICGVLLLGGCLYALSDAPTNRDTGTADVQAQQITYLTYDVIVARLHRLALAAPQYVQLWNAQERYDLASPGRCRAATNQESDCLHWFVTLTNTANASSCEPSHISSAPCLRDRPQVFLSGNLHGNEVVGPMTLLYLLEDLVALRLGGTNPWVNFLFDHRYLVAIPITNPLGYDRGVREENGIDPNRDFPYSQQPNLCMQTLTARAVNEVWREHIFRAAITFHGGMQAIAYEWGADNHMAHGSESPDDVGQRAVSLVMREVAGSFQGSRYPVDRLNTLVYPVSGGMEDWAYAGSWDTNAVQPCAPTTNGGYPVEKTVYAPATLRAFNILVETSDAKRPTAGSLGMHPRVEAYAAEGWSVADVFAVEGSGDGHVPRNIRLALAVLDLADPYVQLTHLSVAPVRVTRSTPRRRRLRAASASLTTINGDNVLSPQQLLGSLDQSVLTGRDDTTDADDDTTHRLEAAYASLKNAASAAGVETSTSNSDYNAAQASVIGRQLDSAPAYTGPRACVGKGQVGASFSPCVEHKDSYASWTDMRNVNGTITHEGVHYPAADFTLSTTIGWDVGGAVTVDATSVLLGTWDARVPPAWFREQPIGDFGSGDYSAAAVPTASLQQLQLFGLSEAEATSFAVYARVWQAVAKGQLHPSQMPPSTHIRHSPTRRGVTRWVFGDLGEQPQPLDSKSRRQQDESPSGSSPVVGAPDLVSSPFVTRFTDCFLLQAPSTSITPGDAVGCASSGTAASPRRRRVEVASPLDASVLVQAYIAIPYAVVDGDWQQQQSPEPAGTPPQSHLVNARHNPAWVHESNGYRVQGRSHASLEPIFIAMAEEVAFEVVAVALCELAAVPPVGATSIVGGKGGLAQRDDVIAGLGVTVMSVIQWAAVVSGMLLATLAYVTVKAVRERGERHTLDSEGAESESARLVAPNATAGQTSRQRADRTDESTNAVDDEAPVPVVVVNR